MGDFKKVYTTKQVHAALSEIIVKIGEQHIPKINFGGCGWFAHYILKEFERYNIDISEYWVVYLVDYGFDSEEEIEYNLENRCGKRSCSHIMVKYDGLYYDAYNCLDRFDDDVYFKETEYLIRTNSLDLRKACEHRPDWNDTYDYKTYNTQLRKIIYNAFKKNLK